MPGIDIARAVALLGMVAVHVGPTDIGGLAGSTYALPHGRASIVFVLVAGVGVSLLATSRHATPARTRIDLAWRAVVLIPLGLALQELDGHRILVVLADYGLLFLLAALVIGLHDRWLLIGAALSAVGGPVAFAAGRMDDPSTFARRPIAITDPLAEIAHGLALSGPYPLVTWAAPFLLGMWLGRRDLTSAALRAGMVITGVVVAVVASAAGRILEGAVDSTDPGTWAQLVDASPHSQMHPWIIGATGTAVAVVATCLWVGDAVGSLTWPVVALGRLPLTFYVGHLLALEVWREVLAADEVGPAVVRVAGFAVAGIVVAVSWLAVLPRGPLEALVRAPRLLFGPSPGGTHLPRPDADSPRGAVADAAVLRPDAAHGPGPSAPSDGGHRSSPRPHQD